MIDISTVTAVVLAGGEGKRLRAAVPDRQKVMAPISGRPFLTFVLDRLSDAGIGSVVMCTGYRGDEVRAQLGERYDGLSLRYSQEAHPLDTAGALRNALSLISSNPVLVLNGDSYCGADLRTFFLWHMFKRSSLSLMLARVPDTSRYWRVAMDSEGRIRAFSEKGISGRGWISAGIYALSWSLLTTIPEDRPMSLEREMLPAWLPYGIYGWYDKGEFIDIGTPESYADAEKTLRTEICATSSPGGLS
ncbi:MAG: NTP transferase domain-containing protein [candidate division Zixibacteria bacterium]|nr:NTP transferase domain-containing protein [candidate division Zixibacteria bacterium]